MPNVLTLTLATTCDILTLSVCSNIHASDSDEKTCLHHASHSRATLAQSLVDVLIREGSELGTVNDIHFSFKETCHTPWITSLSTMCISVWVNEDIKVLDSVLG